MKKMYLAYKQHKSVQILGTLIIFKLRLPGKNFLVWVFVSYPKIGF